jgi:hypothetical protein
LLLFYRYKTDLISFWQKEMVNLYNQGQSKEFFRRWLENVPVQKIEDDLVAQKLELELNIHFAVYPFRIGSREASQSSLLLIIDHIHSF